MVLVKEPFKNENGHANQVEHLVKLNGLKNYEFL
jgi:hypothetical protein